MSDHKLTIGECYNTTVLDLGEAGEGICHVQDMVVFVQGATLGDEIRLSIKTIKNHYALGELLEIRNPSWRRIDPPCPYYPRCGGCQIQELDYQQQLRWKERRLAEILRRIGGITKDPKPIIGMEKPWHYRNKMSYPVQEKKIGLYEKSSHEVVDIEACLLHPSKADDVLRIVRNHLKSISAYDEKSHRGVLRHVMIRSDEKQKKFMVVLVTHEDGDLRDLTRALMGWGAHSVIENKNHQRGNRILGDENRVLAGERELPVKLGNYQFSLSPQSFYQVNHEQMLKLYQQVKLLVEGCGEEILFDIYAGMGTIGAWLSDAVKKVYSIEIVKSAIKDGVKSAKNNDLQNIEFLHGDAGTCMKQLLQRGIHPDILVVDPPRKGLSAELIESILHVKPPKLIYVSCKPSTLARDLKILVKDGYQVVRIQPIDLFPHTTHVETVVLLQRS